MSNLIRTITLQEPVKIGEVSNEAEMVRLGRKELQSDFPDVRTELAAEGFWYVPLKEIMKISRKLGESKIFEYGRGRDDGYKDGLEKGRLEAKAVFDDFASTIKDVIAQRHSLLSEAEAHIVTLIRKISRRITFETAEADPKVTEAIVKSAIESLLDKRKIKIKVNPDHLPHLERHIEDFKALSGEIKEFDISADARVKFGGCFIETPSGDIDARLETLFQSIEEAALTDIDFPSKPQEEL
ncbi:MAG: hypothetical protein IIB00_08705 [candidate division Zixibacteria bacterium]|nr:hypothetical protein [candidate division Zixibacteria bacterium]